MKDRLVSLGAEREMCAVCAGKAKTCRGGDAMQAAPQMALDAGSSSSRNKPALEAVVRQLFGSRGSDWKEKCVEQSED